MPADLHEVVRSVLELPGTELRGIGTNLACQNGVVPDASNMAELSALTTSVEMAFGVHLDIVSGGNSANLRWALEAGVEIGRINQLRLGESILLGREPTQRSLLDGLHADAVSIVGEVIESKRKPSQPRGEKAQTAFGRAVDRQPTQSESHRVIVALGRQDVDTEGLVPPEGFTILGSSSDHLVLEAVTAPRVGAELHFVPDYSALMRAMASPFLTRRYLRSDESRLRHREVPSPSGRSEELLERR
jgi:predicted amino acid racemase